MAAGRPAPLSPARTLWLTGGGVSLIAACYGLARFAYGLFVPAFAGDFGLDGAAVGAIAASSYVSYCIAVLAASVLTPRWGGRVIAAVAGGMAAVGTLLVALAPDTAVLTVGVVLAGASAGAASPPLAHIVASAIRAEAVDRTQSVINSGTGFGVMVAGPIALLAQGEWRMAWLAFSALSLLATVWVVAVAPGSPSSRKESPPAPRPRSALPVGGSRLVVAAVLLGVGSAATWTFGRDVLITVGGMSERDSVIAWILLGAFGALGAVAGDLIGRLGFGRAWSVSVLLMAASTAVLALAPGSTLIAWSAMATFGAAYIAVTGLLLIWGTRVCVNAPSVGVGTAFLALALGQAAGSPLIGALSDTAGPQLAFTVAALLAASGVLVRPHPG